MESLGPATRAERRTDPARAGPGSRVSVRGPRQHRPLITLRGRPRAKRSRQIASRSVLRCKRYRRCARGCASRPRRFFGSAGRPPLALPCASTSRADLGARRRCCRRCRRCCVAVVSAPASMSAFATSPSFAPQSPLRPHAGLAFVIVGALATGRDLGEMACPTIARNYAESITCTVG